MKVNVGRRVNILNVKGTHCGDLSDYEVCVYVCYIKTSQPILNTLDRYN